MPVSRWSTWLKIDPARLPAFPSHADVAGERPIGAETLGVELTVAETAALIERGHKAYRTQPNDLLLTALYGAVSRWTATDQVYIDLEGHGREPLSDDVDLSRTVGWFTSIFPVLLQGRADWDARESICGIKEQLRDIPSRGVTFGIGRYLRPARTGDDVSRALTALPRPEISFNYLGRLDQGVESRLFSLLDRSPGEGRHRDERRTHALDVVAFVQGGRLRIDWTFDRARLDTNTIRQVADAAIGALRELIDHCVSPGCRLVRRRTFR